MSTVTRKLYCDPGHGWLAVKTAELDDLGIAQEISHCSYQRGKTTYLEEDCDAPRYIEAQKARGVKVDVVCKHTNRRSPIRSYLCYIFVAPGDDTLQNMTYDLRG